MLESYFRERLQKRDILLMTHIVIGYPSMNSCMELVESMVEAGVDLMELQIPFSEPMADGPVIVRANADALSRGATVERSLSFAREVTRRFDIPFLFMTYYNIAYRRGVGRFVADMAGCGVRGAIIPDLPPEEAQDYLSAMEQDNLAPVFILSPTSTDARMQTLGARSRGFVYCVARRGVTGAQTHFDAEFEDYIARCRAATDLPLALGFGVKAAEDIERLRGKVEIAVVGSETIRVVDRGGPAAVSAFIRGLRP